MNFCRVLLPSVSFCYRHALVSEISGFVPEHRSLCENDIHLLQSFVNKYRRLYVLTGAGISTESGVPDYRSKGVGLYDRSPNRPVIYRNFISSELVRKRYWARNYVGWKRFSSVEPNDVHLCLTKWEKSGALWYLVTQNVDRLHQKAGSEQVTELHGTAYRVRCLNCNFVFPRHLLQERLREINPTFETQHLEIRPDGDAELDASAINRFNVYSCERCNGILKPDIVFFGESVPKDRAREVHEKVSNCDAVLVLGSSLQVYSGYSIILTAVEQKKPVAIVNIGPTRADGLASLKLDVKCGDILPKMKI